MKEHVVHAMIASGSLESLFSDELDIRNSEVILIFQWTWEEVLSGDTSLGVLESKYSPSQMELPIKQQHLEMHRGRENPAPVLQRALKEPVWASPENQSGISRER